MTHLTITLIITVVPLEGTWIETPLRDKFIISMFVVPLEGTWIETSYKIGD